MNILDLVECQGKGWSHFDCSRGLTLDCDNMRLAKNPDSLFLRGLRFRKVARVSPLSSQKDIQGVHVLMKLLTLLDRINSITNGKITEVDAGNICHTICRNLHGFAPCEYQPGGGGHSFNFEELGPRVFIQQEQKGESIGEQVAEHAFTKMNEVVVQCEGEEQHDESNLERKEGCHSPEDHAKAPFSFDAFQKWLDARLANSSAGYRTIERLLAKDRFMSDNIDTPSKETCEQATSFLCRMILTLQAKWQPNSTSKIHAHEIPGWEDFTAMSHHFTSSLDHCLTKSRFYIPLPDWSETTPVEDSIGIGPAEMEPNDQVAILFGCKHPVILRPEGSSWLYVGPAYAHEMMIGQFVSYWEYFREQGYTGVESEVFEIR
jgi:hypothetical protein